MTELTKPDWDKPVELAHDIIDRIAADFRRPEYRAGFVVTTLTLAWCTRNHARLAPSLLIAFIAGKLTEDMYGKLNQITQAVTRDAPGEV